MIDPARMENIHGAKIQDWPDELVQFWAAYYHRKLTRYGKKQAQSHWRANYQECKTELFARKLAAP